MWATVRLAQSYPISGAVLNFNFNPSVDAPPIFANIFMSPPQIKTHGFEMSKTRGIIIGSIANSVIDISSYYVASFGQLPLTGDHIFVELQPFGGSIPYIFASQYFIITVG